MKNKILFLLALLGFFVGGCGKQEIVVIGVAPLSGAGAVYGKPQMDAAAMAVEEINQSGGLLGKQIRFIPYDDKADPREAATIAQQVVTNGDVIAVVGCPNSGTAMAASKVYNQYGYPLIVSSATNPKITEQGFKNVFRFVPTDAMQGRSIALFAKDSLRKNDIWIVYSNMEYGKGLAQSIRDNFLAVGGNVKYFDAVQPDAAEYRSTILKLKKTKPDLIAFPAMLPEAAKFIRQLKEENVTATVLLGDGAFDEQLRPLSGTNCNNVILSFLAPPWESIPTAAAFVRKFKQRYGSLPPFTPYGYETIQVLAAAVRKAASFERDRIIAALRTSGFSVDGIIGRIAFDQNGQAKDSFFYFYKFDSNGKLVGY